MKCIVKNGKPMKIKALIAIVLAVGSFMAEAQSNQPADDWKPAASNMPGQQYPQVNSEGRVRARLSAPQAQNVQLNISGIKFPMTKDTNGVWIGDSTPQDPGNHYYGLMVDGAEVPDPNGSFIFGSGAWRTDIEIPASDEDFYALKNVPHGQVREMLISAKPATSSATALSIRRPITTRIRTNVSRCFICNTATTKMKPAGVIRAAPD
jgi:hypothetical protein